MKQESSELKEAKKDEEQTRVCRFGNVRLQAKKMNHTTVVCEATCSAELLGGLGFM